MKRVEALSVIDEVLGDLPLVVTCGATSREMAHIARRETHLYLLDSMGLAAAVGLGMALAGHRVGAIEGDGSLLMGLSVLSTIRYCAPAGYLLIVLDNHEHASASSFPTQSAVVDLASAIRGFGLPVREAADEDNLDMALRRGQHGDLPGIVVATIEGGNAPNVPLLLEDPVLIGDTFKRALGRHG